MFHRIDTLRMVSMLLDEQNMKVILMDMSGLQQQQQPQPQQEEGRKNDTHHSPPTLYHSLVCDILQQDCNNEYGLPYSTIESMKEQKKKKKKQQQQQQQQETMENHNNNNNNDDDDDNVPMTQQEIDSELNKPFNVRTTQTSMLNITQEQIQQIDHVLIMYDCSFQHVLWKDKRDHSQQQRSQHDNLTILYNDQFGQNMKQCPPLHNNDKNDNDNGEDSRIIWNRQELWSKIIQVITSS